MKNIIKLAFIISIAFIILFFISCNPQADELLSVGSNFVDPNTRVVKVDTFSVRLSTIIMDSSITSNTETALVGYYNDEKTGSLRANCFFQIGLPKSENINTEDIFDSVTLILNYSSYYYGDTTKIFSMSANRVYEDIEVFDDGYLYNNSDFNYLPAPLGVINFYPRPDSDKTIEMKLDDSLGIDLFDKIKNSEDEVSSNEDFIDYFKGLVLVSDSNINKAVLGFKSTDSAMMIRIYGHRLNEELEEWELNFPVINNSSRFNQIISDKNNTELSSLVEQRYGIHSSQTGEVSFVKGGTGLMTNISFPWLGSLLEVIEGEFFSAELVLHPIINDSNSDLLPSGFFLYQGGKYNKLVGIYADGNGTTYYGLVETDRLYNESSITFNITDFIKYELYDSYYDEEHTLILSYDSPVFATSCNQLEIGGFDNRLYKPSLNIYFIYYK